MMVIALLNFWTRKFGNDRPKWQAPATGKSTPEEFQYVYSHDGKLLEADYGLTPQTTTTPPTDTVKSWYQTDLPQTRGRAHYEYDAGGRMMGVYYWWDTLSGGNYTSVPIRANTSQYELGTGLNRGLKTSSTYLTGASGSWQQQRTETYGYDPNLDYLTSADYGSGATTWQYDAAGNRWGVNGAGGWAYDNLNRMTASPGKTYSNDILGNRTNMTGNVVYTWDALNRMMSFTSGSNPTMTYTYRADGMRVAKKTASGNLTQYRYDGQMGVEDLETLNAGGISAQTRFALGARGIDAISKVTPTSSSVSYPLYDCHGNMIAQLAKAGTGGFTVGNEQSFDAWGAPSAIGTQYPESTTSAKYCANLGHKQDDESSLIYMRARYYEPGSGRFISEDESCHGGNWYAYGRSNPVSNLDASGRSEFDGDKSFAEWMEVLGGCFAISALAATSGGTLFWRGATFALLCMSVTCFELALGETDSSLKAILCSVRFGFSAGMMGLIGGLALALETMGIVAKGVAFTAVAALVVYDCALIAALATIDGNPSDAG